MTAAPYVGWVLALLRRLPSPLLFALDAWSHGRALRSAERRRQRAVRRATATAVQK